ncbi:translocase of chloroplast 101, chloroplastic-like [Triticum urartu]|nr:translocase of chloroplast 101, chloroplastic-like [Triticum urartu]
MAFLIRAPLTSFDDSGDDDEGYASSLSSGAASPSRSPSTSPPVAQPRPRPVLGAPRVAAQLSSSTDDDADLFDDAAGSSGDEVLEEVSNGFFRIARVPPPPPSPSSDEATAPSPPASAAGGGSSASSGESEYFGAAEGAEEEEAAADVFIDAGAGSGLEEDGGVFAASAGAVAEGSLDGSFVSSMSVLDDGAAFSDLVNLSDISLVNGGKQGAEDSGAQAVNIVELEPSIGDAGGTRIVDASEGDAGGSQQEQVVVELPPAVNSSQEEEDAGLDLLNDDSDAKDTTPKHEVAELPHVVSSTEAEGIGPEVHNADSDAKDTTPKHEVVTHSEDASPEHVATRDATVEPAEVHTNVDSSQFTVEGGHHKVDGETDGDYELSDEPASAPIVGTNNALESPGKEMEDSVPASKGTHFGLDDSDEDQLDGDYEVEELSGKETELFDYAALAELLRAANRSPAQGKAKVFPVETSDSIRPSHTVVGVPRTSVASTHAVDAIADPESTMTDEEKKLYIKVDMARIKYLRLVYRLGYDTEHQVPVQVLYRLSLVEGFRRIRMANHSSELENAWSRALQLEAEGIDDLEFSCNVLVLGKTGVGKSATINSIFGEDKSKTNAFLPATCSVKEITGVVGGVKFRVIDTPGLGTTVRDEKSNRKMLKSVKKYIKKCPPDIVLYVDRIDTQRQGADDLSLLQCITSVLGLPIWSKAIITLTHSAADPPPEGPSGSPINFEMIVTHRTHALQQSIRQTTNDARIENPVALVENHHLCRRNMEGEKVLPNGLIWKRLLLLLCYSLKMVAEIDTLSTRRAAPPSLFDLRRQMPPLPYFLSSLLQSKEHPRRANEQKVESVDSDVDPDELLDDDQEDEEYDQLPPFKPLSKSQVAKLSKEQQKLYFDEYDYRTKLLQKKQLKEQRRRSKEMKKSEGNDHDVLVGNDHPDDEYDNERSLMPDWALPSSFDSDDPVFRYRCLEPATNLLARAVTNPEGWDHDCGFDGVSLQYSHEVAKTFPASMWVQVNKDKREFTIHSESSISAKHSEYASTLAGFDIQTMMDQLAYTLRGETKFRNAKNNATTGGLSMTLAGNTMITGAKLEDKLSVGNWLTLVANAGAVSVKGDTAHGLNVVLNLLQKDYPIMGLGLATLGASLVRWHKEWTTAANLDTQFSVGRTSNMAVHVDVNNKLTGRVSIKANSSEHLTIALLGVYSMAMYMWNRMHPRADPNNE